MITNFITISLVWFWALQSVFCYLDWDLLLKTDSKWLQTSMPETGFEPADYSSLQ